MPIYTINPTDEPRCPSATHHWQPSSKPVDPGVFALIGEGVEHDICENCKLEKFYVFWRQERQSVAYRQSDLPPQKLVVEEPQNNAQPTA